MTLQDKINLAISTGRIEGAKKLASKLFRQEHKAEWDRAKRADYEVLYMHTVEYTEIQQDDEGASVEVIKTKQELKLDAPSYDDWLNETRVVSEATYMTYEEYVQYQKDTYGEYAVVYDEQGYANEPRVKTPEVSELVRPYVEVSVEDKVKVYLQERYAELRAKAYPPLEMFADAWVKDDQEEMEEYRRLCLEVKTRYPK